MEFRKDIAHYDWLVSVLVKAYMDDTLVAGSPCACGMGNIIYASALKRGMDVGSAEELSIVWARQFGTTSILTPFKYMFAHLYSELRSNGKHTQYVRIKEVADGMYALGLAELPPKVLLDLEWEFETNQTGDTKDERMFNGLLAFIEVLDKYFEVGDYAKGETKEKFVQVHKSKLCVIA